MGFDPAPDELPQRLRLERLVHARVLHAPEELAGLRRERAAGEEDDARGLIGGDLDEPIEELHPGHRGHHQIADDGVEALVRWRHPTDGLIGPDQFVPLAESTGLIVSLGNWVLQRACADAASWPEHIKVAINISAIQFKSGNLFDVILCTLVETGLRAERLELEITETEILEDQEAYLASIRQLKNLGISIVLDDFGTGYSSVNYLTVFPFDKIKIDKSYTEGVLKRRDCKAVVSSTLTLAKGLGMLTTAEGIETEEQLAYMREAGVDLVQGYLLGRPVPLAQLHFQNENNEMVA